MELILNAHPKAAYEKNSKNFLPLHYSAFRNKNPKANRLILDAYPKAVAVKNLLGSFPQDYTNMWDIKDVIEILDLALDKFMNSVPEEYLCPITHHIMTDPVTTEDGHTYDRKAIENWFQICNRSPMTNLELFSTHLEPNTELKKKIDYYMEN